MSNSIYNQLTNLCINLNNLGEKGHLKTIVVTSPEKNDGKTTIAIQITNTLVEQGKKILIVDADLQESSLSTKLEVNGRPGLTNLLNVNESENVFQFILNTQIDGLDILPVGQDSYGNSTLIKPTTFDYLFNELKKHYNYIIFDSASIEEPFTRQLVSNCDGTVVIVRQNVTKKTQLIDTMKKLKELDSNVIGCVLNAVE